MTIVSSAQPHRRCLWCLQTHPCALHRPKRYSNARRNKYFMGETVRAAGVRAVRQCRATEWAQIEEFLTEWNPNPFAVIVKPIQSAGGWVGVPLVTCTVCRPTPHRAAPHHTTYSIAKRSQSADEMARGSRTHLPPTHVSREEGTTSHTSPPHPSPFRLGRRVQVRECGGGACGL